MLKVTGLRKSYGDKTVLDRVDLAVSPGQIVGLIGNNGEGKTTFISCVTGLITSNGGTVHVGGLDASAQRRAASRLIGVAPQQLGFYPTLSARGNLVAFGCLNGLSRPDGSAQTTELASALGLTELLDQRADELSGGQQRRLHTAMAILHRPRLLFLDEPTVGADVSSREAILSVVAHLAATGTAIVYTTHYLTELETLGADIALLDGGRIVERGPVSELVRRWGTSTVTLRFTGDAPPLPGWLADGEALTLGSIDTNDAGAAAASALGALGAQASRLRSVDIQRPSLESAYLAITGRRFEADHADAA